VTIEYRKGKPARVDAVVISTQHCESVSNDDLRNAVLEHVIKPVVPDSMLDKNTKYYINPTGRFVIGGPMGDAGLTGRKIIVASYGGYSRHGGGAFSGKDPSKVDRSACYMARYIAKNVVAAGLATRAEVQLAYAIGVAEPVSVMVDSFGTSTIPEERITQLVRENFALTPKGIIETLDLRKPIYKPTAAYGHFGRTGPGFTWERTDRADALRKAANHGGVAEVAARRYPFAAGLLRVLEKVCKRRGPPPQTRDPFANSNRLKRNKNQFVRRARMATAELKKGDVKDIGLAE